MYPSRASNYTERNKGLSKYDQPILFYLLTKDLKFRLLKSEEIKSYISDISDAMDTA